MTARPSFAELFAALPVAALVVDDADRIAEANAEAELLLNRSERVMRGQLLDAVLAMADGSPRRAGNDVAVFDTVVAGPDGRRMRVDLHQAALADHPGWRVVTLHQVASRRFGPAAERAGGARAAVGAAAMLAHEIRNPLSGIRGAAQLLSSGDGAGELTRLIVTEVDRIAALIDRMQDFTDTRPLALAPTNIYPLLAHARDVASAGFASGIDIEERFDPSLPLALVNADALLQILLNLLKNAAEALGTRGLRRITLTTAYRHGVAAVPASGGPMRPLPIEIGVVDTGPGAPVAIADHLFDPFVSGRPEGTGLGLALVDKLVRDMGGMVQYAREGMPHVTTFRLLLPRADP